MSEPPDNSAHDPYGALRNRNYRCHLMASIFTVIGQQIQSVALGHELFERTNSALVLGYLALAIAVPMILFTLPAGQVADWYRRKGIIQKTTSVALLCALGLGFLSANQGAIEWMFLCVIVRSAAGTFGRPARSSLLPQIVPPETFANAVTWNSTAMQFAMVAGPAAGGLLAHFSLPTAYWVDAVCSGLSLICISQIRENPTAPTAAGATWAGLVAGLRFVFRSRLILAALTLDLLAGVLGGVTYLLPVFASDILDAGADGLGWLRSSPAAGAVAMGLLLAYVPMRKAGRALLWAVAGFGLATIVFGISKNIWLSCAMLFLAGAFDSISIVVRHSLVQLLSPEAMRGRISAVNSLFIGASNELGGLESGVTAYWWGPVVSAIVGGMGTIVVVLGVALIWPQLGRIGRLSDLKPEPEADERAGNAGR